MPALVARAIALAQTKPVVCVTTDLEAARRLTDDLGFVWGGRATETAQNDVLLFAPPESSPYADVNPDRRGAMARLVTLFQLAHALPWRFLVVPAAGLLRKVVPRHVIEEHTGRVVAEQESIATSSSSGSRRPDTCAYRSSKTRDRSRCVAR